MVAEAGPPSVLILGGTSAIAGAYARLCAQEGLRVVLVGRNKERLEKATADLEVRGAASAAFYLCDLANTNRIALSWEGIVKTHGAPSEVLLAYGVLGDLERVKSDADALRESLVTNFVSAAIWLECAAKTLLDAGTGRIVVIGSVAGDRGRQSNYPYGAAKGGLELYAQGLSHRFALAGGRVTMHLIKPGFVDTPMTDGMAKNGPLWASPDQVAGAMRRAVKAGRPVAYVPRFWQAVMMIIRALPRFILHKTGL